MTRAIGRAKTLGLALTGERLGAEQAERMGLVYKVPVVCCCFADAARGARPIRGKSIHPKTTNQTVSKRFDDACRH